MLEQLTFMEEGKFTGIDDTVRGIAENLKKKSEVGNISIRNAISSYLAKLKYDEFKKNDEYRKRTASQILSSGYTTGCTDTALAFIALARCLGIPTEYLETFELKWFNKLSKRRADSMTIEGHVFAGIKIKDTWRVYDPLTGFTVGNDYFLKNKHYVLVGMGLDFSELYIINIDTITKTCSI